MYEQTLQKYLMTMTECLLHISAPSPPTNSSHSARLPRLPDHNRLHSAAIPHGRPAPQRRQRALLQTHSQHPPGCLQRVADVPPAHPLRLHIVHDVDDDLAGPEGFRIREAHVGARAAAEGVGRRDCFAGG